jgi:hypothetical protein
MLLFHGPVKSFALLVESLPAVLQDLQLFYRLAHGVGLLLGHGREVDGLLFHHPSYLLVGKDKVWHLSPLEALALQHD